MEEEGLITTPEEKAEMRKKLMKKMKKRAPKRADLDSIDLSRPNSPLLSHARKHLKKMRRNKKKRGNVFIRPEEAEEHKEEEEVGEQDEAKVD